MIDGFYCNNKGDTNVTCPYPTTSRLSLRDLFVIIAVVTLCLILLGRSGHALHVHDECYIDGKSHASRLGENDVSVTNG